MAFLSEMRHPMDFWKAMLCAQLFISIVYIFFGAFVSHSCPKPVRKSTLTLLQVYSYYGQYAYVTITQVVQPLSLQILNNVLGLLTGWLAVCKSSINLVDLFAGRLTSVSSPVLQRRHENRLRRSRPGNLWLAPNLQQERQVPLVGSRSVLLDRCLHCRHVRTSIPLIHQLRRRSIQSQLYILLCGSHVLHIQDPTGRCIARRRV